MKKKKRKKIENRKNIKKAKNKMTKKKGNMNKITKCLRREFNLDLMIINVYCKVQWLSII